MPLNLNSNGYIIGFATAVCLVSSIFVSGAAVSLKEHPKVNEWLTCVETEMRTTLATLLATAVTEIQQFNSESIDGQKYMHWVDGYQVKKISLC